MHCLYRCHHFILKKTKTKHNCILISLELLFRCFCSTESRQQLILGPSVYWHSQRSPHIPCHGEVTQTFSVLSLPSALWESDQKQFYDQELLTLTSCQEWERRGSKWSAAHIATHVQCGNTHEPWNTCHAIYQTSCLNVNCWNFCLIKPSSRKILTMDVWRNLIQVQPTGGCNKSTPALRVLSKGIVGKEKM